MINAILGGVLGTAWSVAKNVGRGVAGSTKGYRKDLAKHIKTIGSGGKTFDKAGKAIDQDALTRTGNLIKSTLGLARDATFGTLGQGLGWTARGLGIGGFAVGRAVVPPVTKAVGRVAEEVGEIGLDVAGKAASTAYNLTKSPYGRGLLVAAPMAGMAAYGGLKEGSGTTAIDQAVQFAVGRNGEQAMTAIGGSVTAPARARKPDNFGADGDLVFALHNLR